MGEGIMAAASTQQIFEQFHPGSRSDPESKGKGEFSKGSGLVC